MLALAFYDVVVAIHVMAVVATFGVIFAYPIFVPWLRRTHPEAMPAVHHAQDRVGRLLISPGIGVVLIAGIYLATKAKVWSEVWVTVPLVILLVIGALGGAFFSPNERRLGELARRDLATDKGFSAEYDALFSRVAAVGVAAAVLVLIAIFFMVAKPGA
ncbi:MAG: hypothetical protein JWR30_1305 [Conexibacter sp.]|nr:hypothetical protein [Conexibacter sp.]